MTGYRVDSETGAQIDIWNGGGIPTNKIAISQAALDGIRGSDGQPDYLTVGEILTGPSHRRKPEWVDDDYVLIGSQYLTEVAQLIAAALARWVVIQTVVGEQVCDRRCLEAQGHDCVCRCQSAHHGMQVLMRESGTTWMEGDTIFVKRVQIWAVSPEGDRRIRYEDGTVVTLPAKP